MFFLALATDYDGTIAEHGFVRPETCTALRRLKDTGRRLILVTGREREDLEHAFPDLAIFERVVLENGGVVYDPSSGQERAIAPPPPANFVQELMERKIEPISVGRTIVATWHPHEAAVLSIIRELGLELEIVFNKGAVMVLPTGINKASGLKAALDDLDISSRNVVGAGDAENDHAFLRLCGCAAAVANALPSVKDECDLVLSSDHGAGVIELVHKIIEEDAALVPLSRHGLYLGSTRTGEPVYLAADKAVLLTGDPKTGKSSLATLLTERIAENGLEFCVLDPEGDYQGLAGAVTVGDAGRPPAPDDTLKLLLKAGDSMVVNTLALTLEERQRLFAHLLPSLLNLRARTGRPHWLIVDEAHHFIPAAGKHCMPGFPTELPGAILISADPAAINRHLLRKIDYVLAFGTNAPDLLRAFARAADVAPPTDILFVAPDEIAVWSCKSKQAPYCARIDKAKQAHRRHQRKYTTGNVGEQRSFYFRGPTASINVAAHNLVEFLSFAEQVGDDVWEHHLRASDYTAWFRNVIKDDDLSNEAQAIAADKTLSPTESRKRIHAAISTRYALS